MVGWYHLKTGQNGSDFKWHLKTGPFEDRTCLYHSNTGLVRYSDGYCTKLFYHFNNGLVLVLYGQYLDANFGVLLYNE